MNVSKLLLFACLALVAPATALFASPAARPLRVEGYDSYHMNYGLTLEYVVPVARSVSIGADLGGTYGSREPDDPYSVDGGITLYPLSARGVGLFLSADALYGVATPTVQTNTWTDLRFSLRAGYRILLLDAFTGSAGVGANYDVVTGATATPRGLNVAVVITAGVAL